jgi:23S rRNA (uracil1939-C5)-methyltransferase
MIMKLNKGQTLELSIDKMAYGGQGIARVNGLVVFLRNVVTGDKIRARVYRKKRDYAEAAVVELITPSPDRVSPPCPYYGYCGGCHWQHIRYEKQLSFKAAQVRESLEHIGKLKDVVIHNALPSEHIFAYRNKMEFSFSDRRWFLPHELDQREIEGDFALGLHVPGAYQKVVDIEACLLQPEQGNEILRTVKRYVRKSGVPVYGLKSHQGFWRFLTIRHSTAFNEWMINLITSEARTEVTGPLVSALTDQIGQIKTVVNSINRRRAYIAVGDREILLKGGGYIRDKIGAFTFRISANSFFQTNSLAAQQLYEKVLEFAELAGDETILDLYCGTGTIPIFLARHVKSVVGIEINESAVLDAQRNCVENGIGNCQFICGDIREKLSAVVEKPDVLIIDPPRAGMHKDVLTQVLALSSKKIIYVSCHPATLARDIGQMLDSYELLEIQPVDMFPHTYHVESVAKLCLRKRG